MSAVIQGTGINQSSEDMLHRAGLTNWTGQPAIFFLSIRIHISDAITTFS